MLELKSINFNGLMENYEKNQIYEICQSLPNFISYTLWSTNKNKKIRLFAKQRLEKNFIIAKVYAPFPQISNSLNNTLNNTLNNSFNSFNSFNLNNVN